MIPGLEISNLHAQGGMAEVYRARGKGADGRTWHYAVKRILPELTQDATLRSMFVEEARIASLLVHPNIVRVYDLARGANDDYYIVMEFLEGRDLAETIDKAQDEGRALPVWLCIHVAIEVLRALTYATTEARDREGNALALIHRDISPHNIFVCFDGQVKLTDFGVAKVAQSNVLTQVGVTKGKFGYMSPEQLLSEKLDFRSDLFNVGILLYETLTGRRLFFGDNPSQFLQAMLRAEVPPLDPRLGVPPELDALLRRALTKEREVRPDNAEVFAQELTAIAQRYGLLASREHVSTEVRAIFGSEILSCPVPAERPATAPRMLASVQAAQPEAVQRAPSRVRAPAPEAPPEAPSVAVAPPAVAPQAQAQAEAQVEADGWSTPADSSDVFATPAVPMEQLAPQIVPTQARTRSLSAASGEPERRAPQPRVPTRPQGPSLATASSSGSGAAPRPGTRSVRPLPELPNAPDPKTLPPDDADPALRLGAMTSLSPRGDDPSTLPPESKGRRSTVVIVGGGGAKAIQDRDVRAARAARAARQNEDSRRAVRMPEEQKPTRADDEGDWSDATLQGPPPSAPTGDDSLEAKPSVVTRSPRVVPLPSPSKRSK